MIPSGGQPANDVLRVIADNPRACYRTLHRLITDLFPDLTVPDWASHELDAARPECGYRCDGDEGPHEVNGSPGCFYSGKIEP